MLVAENMENEDAAVDAAVAAVQPPVQEKHPIAKPQRCTDGFNVRVHFSAPYIGGSVLVFLTTRTIATFTDMITMNTVSTLDQWWSIGMPGSARVWLSASISGGRRVFQQDEDLELDIGYSEGIEAFVGDRRENGGVSTRW